MLEIFCNPLGNKIHRVQYLMFFILAHKATGATLCKNVLHVLNRIPHILRALEIEIALRCTHGIIINKRTNVYLFSENNDYYFICIHVEIFSLIHNFRMDEKNKWSMQ